MRIKFTKGWVEKLVVDKRARFTDEGYPALSLRVTPSGAKTFYYRARHKDRGIVERSIGRFGQWTVEQARRKAAEYAAGFNAGIDIDEAQRKADLQSVSMDTIAQQWLQEIKHQMESGDMRLNTYRSYEQTYRTHIKPELGTRRLSAITADQVQALLRGQPRSPSQHNNIILIIRAIYRHAGEALPSEIEIPLKGVKRRDSNRRERYLRPAEVTALFESLMLESQMYQDLVLTLLFTGQRKEVVYTMTWAELDFDRGVWVIPGTKQKNRRPHAVPLIDDMVAILKRRKGEAAQNVPWVFPAPRKPGRHIPIKSDRYWRRITDRAGLRPDDLAERLTIHDLRRTLASWQAMEGVGINVIAKALGHRNIGITASTYAHLDTGAARKGIEAAIGAINRAAGRDGDTAARKVDAILEGLSEEERAALIARLTG